MTKKTPRPSSYPRRPDSDKRQSKKDRVRQRNRRVLIACILFALFFVLAGTFALRMAEDRRQADIIETVQQNSGSGPEEWMAQGAPYIDVQLLTPNEYSRPQLSISNVSYIAIHYTANPGASAQNNRDYFENLAQTHETKVSSHFVVGLEGEVIQCIPTSELSYATNERNVDTLSIECCHPDESGVFNDATYESVVKLAAWLCLRFGLTQDNVIRHYDVTGKECPKYYVDHPEAWEQMKADIAAQIEMDKSL